MRTTEENNFTPLRLLLASLVVLGHYKAFVGIFSPPWPFGYAAVAVECFFVVSGYLVSNSFDRDPNPKRFFIRRVCRIYPLYLAVVLVQTVVLGCMAEGGIAGNLRSMAGYLTANALFLNFIQHDIGNGVLTHLVDPSLNASLWTLKVEFAFYLALPILWRATERYGWRLLAGIFLASAAYQAAFLHAGMPTFAKQLPGALQYFVLGIAAYRYRQHLTFRRRWIPALLAGALLTLMMAWRPPLLFPPVVAAFVVLAALHTPRIGMKRDISYGVYLLHAPLIQLSLLFGLYDLGLAVLLPAVLVLALLAERFVELPGIAFGRRLTGRMRDQPPPPDGLSVVVLNDFCHVQGGASKVAIDEAVALAHSGINVVFVGAVGPVCEELRNAPLTVECLDQHQLLEVARHPGVILQGLWNGKAARRVSAILRHLPADRTIVHLHGYTKALSTSPVRAAARLGVPVVCTLHDFFAACPNGAFFNYEQAAPCRLKALSSACLKCRCDKRHPLHKWFRVARMMAQRRLGRFPAAIGNYISLSERSAALLTPYLPANARLFRLPNMVAASKTPPVEAGYNRTILYVGRLDEEKGVRLLANTAFWLGLKITFVGEGPLRHEIEAIPGMKVTGWLAADELQDHLAKARCLVFPSLWYETFGLTVAEAASRGVPAVVSDISAAAERVKDGVTGWRFKSGDAADLARCLGVVEDDRKVAAAGAAAYRAFWRDPPTSEAHARGLLGIYRGLMA